MLVFHVEKQEREFAGFFSSDEERQANSEAAYTNMQRAMRRSLDKVWLEKMNL